MQGNSGIRIALSIVAAALLAAYNFVDIGRFEKSGKEHVMNSRGFINHLDVPVVDVSPSLPLAVLSGLAALFFVAALVPIMRMNMRRAIALGATMLSMLIVYGGLTSGYSYARRFGGSLPAEITWESGMFLPIAAGLIGAYLVRGYRSN